MSVYSAAFLALNPGGYWRLGEPSGTNAADASTTNNAGTYGGSPTLGVAGGLVGDSDTAVTFDGVAQYVTIPNNAAYNVNLGNYSIAFRFKTTSRANSMIVNYAEGEGGFEANWDGDHLSSRVISSGTAVVSGGANGLLADGLWHDAIISMLRSSNSGQWYVDGVASGAAVDISGTASFNVTGTGTLEIARRYSGLFFFGTVDEVGFFPAALTAGQALGLYNAATLVPAVIRGDYSAFPKFLLQRAA